MNGKTWAAIALAVAAAVAVASHSGATAVMLGVFALILAAD